MKTQQEIKEQIEILEYKIQQCRKYHDKKGGARQTRNLRKYRMVLAFITTNPSESSLLSQQTSLKAIIKSKRSQYEQWKMNNATTGIEKKDRRTFNEKLGLTDLRRQLRTINQILN